MALSNGKIVGLLGAVLLIALLAFAAGFLLGLSTAADLGQSASARAPGNAATTGSGATGSGETGSGATGSGATGSGATGSGATGSGGSGSDASGDLPAAPAPSAAASGSEDAGGADGSPAAEAGSGAGGDGAAEDDSRAPSGGDGQAGAVPAAGYRVLAGEHAVEAPAAAAARRLTDHGFAAEVVALEAADGPWFQVVVGGFASLARAREAAMQIRTELGVDALVGPPSAQAANAEAGG